MPQFFYLTTISNFETAFRGGWGIDNVDRKASKMRKKNQVNTKGAVGRSMKNIWILNHYANSRAGRHYQFAKNLSGKGYNVVLFAASTRHSTGENRISDSRQYVVDEQNEFSCVYVKARDYSGNEASRVMNMIDYAWGVTRISKKLDLENPDVIYASSVHPLTWFSGYLLAKRYKAKFIAETRDLWPETLVAMGRIKKKSVIARLMYAFEKFIYKKADRLIFTMPGGKDYVAQRGLDTAKVGYVNNGVDLREFDYNKKTYVFKDPELDDADSFKVVYAGSMGQANALHYLVKAAKIVQERGNKNIKFLLFGDGYQREELQEYARENRLTNIFFKGRVEKKYIPNILSKSDLNVFTGQHISLYQYGLSLNKMFEYFASGKPTISNLECGYDFLEQYECGVTVRGGSPEALADGILEFSLMPHDKYARFCANAIKAAYDFDFELLTEKLEKIILS